MKGLLHSKRFKENLYRWLFMYVGVIGLLTTVITYSKYVTKMVPHEETGRITNFKADIKYTDKDGNPCVEGTRCTTGVYRPTSEIKYYFTLETEFEVLADLYLTTKIKDSETENFEIISIRNVTTDASVAVNGERYTLEIQNELDVDNRPVPTKEVYEVTVKYKGTISSSTDFSKEAKPVIEVGYTAEQRNH